MARTKTRFSPEYYREIGSRGGKATSKKKKYPFKDNPELARRAGRLSGEIRRRKKMEANAIQRAESN